MQTDIVDSVKNLLAEAIISAKEQQHLTNYEFGKCTGLAQSDCSDLLNGKLDKFAVQRLLKVTSSLGIKVSLKVEH